jgi:hypothetical protein
VTADPTAAVTERDRGNNQAYTDIVSSAVPSSAWR